MRKLLIFGHCGSGKARLAAHIAHDHQLGHFSLDTVVWHSDPPRRRLPLQDASFRIADFTDIARNGWVIEGSDPQLLTLVSPAANEMIFLDLPGEPCSADCTCRAHSQLFEQFRGKKTRYRNFPALPDESA